jgi:cytoskeleton-associated protein 5
MDVRETRERAFEIILMYIEAEKQEILTDELIKWFENKQPKIVQGCLEVLRRGMNEFGSKTVLIKPILQHLPKLLEDRDKIVREEAKLMAVDMFRWASTIVSQLQSIKPDLVIFFFLILIGLKKKKTFFFNFK